MDGELHAWFTYENPDWSEFDGFDKLTDLEPAPPPIPPALPGAVQALRAEIVAALRKAGADGPIGLAGRVADELERRRG